MKSYYVYILLCADESYYTGVTNNLQKRLAEHNDSTNKISYPSSRRPLQLVYSQEFFDVKQAISLEKQIKGWSRKKKVALIEENWERLKLLSKNYKEHPGTKDL